MLIAFCIPTAKTRTKKNVHNTISRACPFPRFSSSGNRDPTELSRRVQFAGNDAFFSYWSFCQTCAQCECSISPARAVNRAETRRISPDGEMPICSIVEFPGHTNAIIFTAVSPRVPTNLPHRTAPSEISRACAAAQKGSAGTRDCSFAAAIVSVRPGCESSFILGGGASRADLREDEESGIRRQQRRILSGVVNTNDRLPHAESIFVKIIFFLPD